MVNNVVLKVFSILWVFLFISLIGCQTNDSEKELTEYLKSDYDAMQIGIKITADTPEPEKYFNDLIHPCVRYIPEGFAGHKWWMVASPYRGGDASIENPILYYGDSRVGDLPPLKWKAWGVISETPISGGYNSDPNLYFDGKGLWVFWRECFTESCFANKMARATFGVYSSDGITFGPKKFFAGETTTTEDSEMCPIVMDFGGKAKLYGVRHQFEPPRLPWGLSIWEIENNDLENNAFVKVKDVLPEYKKDFDFWHMDLFEYENHLFCVASPGIANEVLIGISSDGENFKFWDKPLISTAATGRNYFYKPTALVHQGIFYMWYPIAEPGIVPLTSRIWMSEINFEELIQKTDFDIPVGIINSAIKEMNPN